MINVGHDTSHWLFGMLIFQFKSLFQVSRWLWVWGSVSCFTGSWGERMLHKWMKDHTLSSELSNWDEGVFPHFWLNDDVQSYSEFCWWCADVQWYSRVVEYTLPGNATTWFCGGVDLTGRNSCWCTSPLRCVSAVIMWWLVGRYVGQLNRDQNPPLFAEYLLYIGDFITKLFRYYNMSHFKDLFEPINIRMSAKGFERCSVVKVVPYLDTIAASKIWVLTPWWRMFAYIKVKNQSMWLSLTFLTYRYFMYDIHMK